MAHIVIHEQPGQPISLQPIFDDLVRQFQSFPWTPFINEEFSLMENQHSAYFAKGRGPDGQLWPGNSPAWQRHKGHNRPLIYKLRLSESLSFRKHADAIREVVDEHPKAIFIFGTSVPYSIYHQEGMGQKIRRHIGITMDDFFEMSTRAVDYAFQEIKKG